MIKAIFWDNDGVLVDTERHYFHATQSVLNSVGVELNAKQMAELFFTRSGGAWHLVQERGYSDEQIEKLRMKRNQLYSDLLQRETVLIPGVKEALECLRPHFKMAVVTTSHREHFDIVHQSTNFMPFFDFVLTREDYTNSKPDPEPYLLAQERSGVHRDACLVIEDSERGLISAKRAGMTCWVIPTDFTKTGNLTAADKILNNVTEVANALLGRS